MTPRLKLGTRGSPLALAQAHQVRALLAASAGWPEDAVEICVIKTSGDRIQDRPLSEVGGKGLFTKELEDALIDRRIDLAVHSMKDVATHLPPGLRIAALLPREDVRDCLLTPRGGGIEALPANARLGTSSLRRAAQMRAQRPDLIIVPFRGNVETRIAKLADGVADATLLAMAGLNRLQVAHTGEPIATEVLLPAPAQGAIGLEIRSDDAETAALLSPLDHAPTASAIAAERAFLAGLDGSCRTPIAALATIEGETLTLRGEILREDGRARTSGQRIGSVGDAIMLGRDLAEALRAHSPIPLG